MIKTNLTESPYVYQITTRLNQLHQMYYKPAVEIALVAIMAGFNPKSLELDIHLNNLLSTYDHADMVDAFRIMQYSELTYKRVS